MPQINLGRLPSVFVALLVLGAGTSNADILLHSLSGSCVHPLGGAENPGNNTPVVLHSADCERAPNRLQFQHTESGSIKHVPSGKCLHPSGGSPTPGNNTNVVLHDGCVGDRIRFTRTEGGSLKHATSNLCIHPEGGARVPANDTKLVLHSGCDEPRLKFEFVNP